MGVNTVNALIKPTFTLAMMKQSHDSYLGFVLNLNIFLKMFKTIQYFKTCNLLFYTSPPANPDVLWYRLCGMGAQKNPPK